MPKTPRGTSSTRRCAATAATFVDDEQFRRALLLTGDGSHLQLPGETLTGEDTLSVTTWLYLPTGASGPIFDFGQNAATRFSAIASPAGFRASIVLDGKCARDHGRAVSREPVAPCRRRARSGRATADDVPRRREGRSGDGRDGERRADRSPNRSRLESLLHRAIAGRRGAGHPRAIPRRPHLSHRVDAINRSRRFATTRSRPRPTTTARAPVPEISTAGIPLESPLAATDFERPRHHGRDRRRLPAASAGRNRRELS